MMLLTLKPSTQNGTNGPHEFSIVRQSVPARRSPRTIVAANPAPLSSSSQLHQDPPMDNHPRRDLPPPVAMSRSAETTMPVMTSPSQLPRFEPSQHSEDSLRQWLRTKAEEDRRRQEEERTRQETLKLEQRRIEQSMLRDAFQAGVPPQMVPLIFVGIGGGNFNVPPEMTQQVESGLQQMQTWQQQQHRAHSSQQQALPTQIAPHLPPHASDPSQPLSPDIRRGNNRAIPPNPYASQPAPIQNTSPSQPVPTSPTQAQLYRGSLQPARLYSIGDAHSQQPSIPRLNTSEIHFGHPSHNIGAAQPQPIAGSSYPPPSAPAPAPSSTKSETQSTQSPSIYFHHWVPPSQSQPSTPSTRGRQESSSRAHGQSEGHTSPGRKRKAAGSHPPPPPPVTLHHEKPSPAFSHSSPRRASSTRIGHTPSHFRQHSDLSHGSRQEHSESDSDNFTRFRPGHDQALEEGAQMYRQGSLQVDEKKSRPMHLLLRCDILGTFYVNARFGSQTCISSLQFSLKLLFYVIEHILYLYLFIIYHMIPTRQEPFWPHVLDITFGIGPFARKRKVLWVGQGRM
ncbi:conserved hypothetical protein [Talaromyces stipitatus ATCC 10500]|uniref:Uncharacterized protein n=1 Tax=Talaromyces stipitatus (strain ATCC 10500 / CBS 375.48 / QM 6759 / NRRL 1006) TaxID=441959 RepID=B8M648_TALSN|nr:uncharacterized protein TSTA_023810 [Talaromyces stipitatus ATCC 10500]EED19048.1 conserved hypothetical protein [Talaromyces stipitatus ATCC 10500]